MVKLYNEHMRDGDGTVEIIRYLEPEEFNGNAKMIAKLVLKPGCSIGEHTHEGEEEIICIAKGNAEYNDNGTMVTLHEGDSCVCLGGQTHGIRNASETENLEAFAVILLYKSMGHYEENDVGQNMYSVYDFAPDGAACSMWQRQQSGSGI